MIFGNNIESRLIYKMQKTASKCIQNFFRNTRLNFLDLRLSYLQMACAISKIPL